MALNIKKAAERHAKITESLIQGSDITLDVKVRATRPTVSGASLFADLADTPDEPLEYLEIKCLWYDATAIPNQGFAKSLQILGKYPDATAVARVWLHDVLLDPTNTHGETLFDIAVDVVHAGHLYKVIATDRHGMANIEPYLLTVVLAGEIRRPSV